jgi:heme/copper-type cytochrome/quinol oxidase subunit 4
MIDPLRPYWPTNRSIAGLILRSACVMGAAATATWGGSKSSTLLIVAPFAVAQATLLVFEWMELRRARRPGLIAAGLVCFIFISLVGVLVLESRSVLVLSAR